MKRFMHPGVYDGLYPWGKAELTGNWVILHRGDVPSWAVYYHKKKPKVAIPCNVLGMGMNSGCESGLFRSDKST
jgi:hypothetical protein